MSDQTPAQRLAIACDWVHWAEGSPDGIQPHNLAELREALAVYDREAAPSHASPPPAPPTDPPRPIPPPDAREAPGRHPREQLTDGLLTTPRTLDYTP